MPMVLLAPPRFSTTTDCLKRSPRCCDTSRATRSAPPPGEYGTITFRLLFGKSFAASAKPLGASDRHSADSAASDRIWFQCGSAGAGLRVHCFIVALMRVSGHIRPVPVVVIVHQLFRDVGKHLARGEGRASRPLHASLLPCGGEEVVPGGLGGIARHLQPLGQRGEDQLPD